MNRKPAQRKRDLKLGLCICGAAAFVLLWPVWCYVLVIVQSRR